MKWLYILPHCKMRWPDFLVGWEKNSISSILAALHWLPIRFRIDFKVLMMTYKALNGLGPRYLTERRLPPRSTQITCHSQERWLRGLTPREAQKERTRDLAFLAVAPQLWNSLPPEIRLAPSLGVFKSQLKTWLFGQRLPSCHYLTFTFLDFAVHSHLDYSIIVDFNCCF